MLHAPDESLMRGKLSKWTSRRSVTGRYGGVGIARTVSPRPGSELERSYDGSKWPIQSVIPAGSILYVGC